MAPAPISTDRRLSCLRAISANVGSVLEFGAGWAQALEHLS